jgi:hypothetical protein
MERAEFIVDADGWKTFYRMKYDGSPERLLAFSALVAGTVHQKVGDLYPDMAEAVGGVEAEQFKEAAKAVAKLARKAAKEAGVGKDYQKFAEMWAACTILEEAGLKLVPDTKGHKSKKILKKI